MMDSRKTALQRAFELARSGKCFHIAEIIKQLKTERYNADQIEGPALKKQLMHLIEKSREQSNTH